MAEKRKTYDITKNPAYITGKKMMDEKATLKKQADAQAEAATRTSKTKFEGYVTDLGYPAIKPVIDTAQQSRRNANIELARRHEENKARGTSSSAVRRIIK